MLKPVSQTVLSLLLSAMMALPTPLCAGEVAASGAKDGLPVFLQQVSINGEPAQIAMAVIPEAAEAELVTKLAKTQASRTILEVSGPLDPALEAAAKTGLLSKIRTFTIGKIENSPMFQSGKLPAQTKEKIRKKVKRFNKFLKRESVGLMVAVSTAAINGGYTVYSSASVSSGVAIFSKLALWNALIITKPEIWSNVLDLGGNSTKRLAAAISGLFGRELSESDKRLYDLVGKFAVSWTMNTVMAGMIKAWAGDLNGTSMGWAGLMADVGDAGWSGIQNNTNVWDIPVLQAYKEGRISKRSTQLYFIGQQIIFAGLEVMAYSGVPYMPIFLSSVTASGLVYLALSKPKQDAIELRAKRLKLSFKYGMARIKPKPSLISHSCQMALAPQKPRDIARADAVWDDIN